MRISLTHPPPVGVGPPAAPPTWLPRAACGLPTVGVTIGTSLFLIAVGAILKYAVTAHVAGVDINTVGVILMVVGAVGLVLGLYLLSRGRFTAAGTELP